MAAPKRAARGGWETWVSVGTGRKRVRVHVRGRTKASTLEAAADVRQELARGSMPSDGRVTLDHWLSAWIDARDTAGRVRPKTITGYRTDAKWVERTIGEIRLCDLAPEDIEAMYGAIRRAGRSPGTVLHVKRTLRAALQTAVDRRRISRNPVSLAEAPADEPPDVEPLEPAEVQAILSTAAVTRQGARWVLALVTGMRQGEVLGLQWNDMRWMQAKSWCADHWVAEHGAMAATTPRPAAPADLTSVLDGLGVAWSPDR